MPISGFKEGDLAETPSGRRVSIIGVDRLHARVRFEDGIARTFSQSALRAIPASTAPPVASVSAISDALMSSANALEKLYLQTGDSNLMSVAYKIDAAVRDLQSIESAGIRR